MKLSGLKVGYLLNFGEALMKEGITRIINGQLPPFGPLSGCTFVGNEKIQMSLKPTGLLRDPTLLFFHKRFLNDFRIYDAFL